MNGSVLTTGSGGANFRRADTVVKADDAGISQLWSQVRFTTDLRFMMTVSAVGLQGTVDTYIWMTWCNLRYGRESWEWKESCQAVGVNGAVC